MTRARQLHTPAVGVPHARAQPTLIPFAQVLLELSISKATGYRWIDKGILPVPLKIGPSRVAFLRHEVDDFIASRPRTNRRNAPQCGDPHD